MKHKKVLGIKLFGVARPFLVHVISIPKGMTSVSFYLQNILVGYHVQCTYTIFKKETYFNLVSM